MKYKIIKPILACVTSIVCLSACNNSKNKWDYSKNDARDFLTFESTTYEYNVDSNLIHFIAESETSFLNNKATKENMILFDRTLLNDDESCPTYYSYEMIKKYEIEYTDFLVSGNSKIEIDFLGENNHNYGILVNKEATNENKFALGYTIYESLDAPMEAQTRFEEEYVTQEITWNDAKTAINIIGGLALAICGAYTGVPTAVITGLFSYATNLGDLFASQSSPTIQDVLDKLKVMEQRLDLLNDKIDNNQKQLLEELVRTQAQIDEVKMLQYDQNIVAYQTDYVEKIEDKLAVYKDYIEVSLATYVKENHTVDVYYGNDEKGKLVLHYPTENVLTGYSKYSYNVTFPEAKAFLVKTNNIVGEGFGKALQNDLKNCLTKDLSYPEGRSLQEVQDDVYGVILNDFQYKRYTNPDFRTDIINFKSAVKNFCNRLAGSVTTSALDSFVNRTHMMFNFAGECSAYISSLIAGLKNQMDKYVMQATSACLYAGINSEDLGQAYLDAQKTIIQYYNANKDLDDDYCLQLKQRLRGDFYRSYWDLSYTNLGNHPSFSCELITQKLYSYDGRRIYGQKVDINSINMISNVDHLRIATRYKLLKANGLTNSSDYLHYLYDLKLISYDGRSVQSSLVLAGYFQEKDLKFLTSFNIENMGNAEENVTMTCTNYGNPDGEYFSIGWQGKFRNSDGGRESKYWAGKIAKGTFVSAFTGETLSDKRITCYATYSESHTLWIDNEYWGFVDHPNGNFYYMMYTL